MREVLRIDEKALGKEHPNYAMDLNNLAGLLRNKVGLHGTHVVEPICLKLFTTGQV